MITLEIIQGQVEVRNLITMYSELARNKMELDTSKEFHYMLKSYKDSYATIIIDGKKIYLDPNSEFTITNNKDRNKVKHSSTARYVVGKIWAWMGGPTDYDSSEVFGGGGVRG